MIRVRVSFDAEDLRRATARAEALGLSLTAYLRRLVAEDLAEKSQPPDRSPDRPSDISPICGLGDSGRSDISANKGRHIAEAIAADEVHPAKGAGATHR